MGPRGRPLQRRRCACRSRNPESDKANALAALGIEVVAGDAHKPETLGAALAGAYGAFVVTNCWEPISAEREGVQASNIARAICCTVHCCDVPFDTYRGLGFPGAAGLRWLARGERLGG